MRPSEDGSSHGGRNGTDRWFSWLLLAGAVQLVGRAVDLRWHATHPGFETAGDQMQAHWLIWLGVLAGLVVALAGLRAVRDRGLWIVAWASVAYVGVAAWHFVEHAGGSDPEIAHVLLGVAWTGVLAGIVDVAVRDQRRRRRDGLEAEV